MSRRTARFGLAVVLLILASAAPHSAWGQGGEVQGLRAVAAQEGTTLFIDTSADTINYTSYSRDRQTLIIDLYGLGRGELAESTAIATTEVESGQYEFTPDKPGYASIARFVVTKGTAGRSQIDVAGSTLLVTFHRAGSEPVQRPTLVAPTAASA